MGGNTSKPDTNLVTQQRIPCTGRTGGGLGMGFTVPEWKYEDIQYVTNSSGTVVIPECNNIYNETVASNLVKDIGIDIGKIVTLPNGLNYAQCLPDVGWSTVSKNMQGFSKGPQHLANLWSTPNAPYKVVSIPSYCNSPQYINSSISGGTVAGPFGASSNPQPVSPPNIQQAPGAENTVVYNNSNTSNCKPGFTFNPKTYNCDQNLDQIPQKINPPLFAEKTATTGMSNNPCKPGFTFNPKTYNCDQDMTSKTTVNCMMGTTYNPDTGLCDSNMSNIKQQSQSMLNNNSFPMTKMNPQEGQSMTQSYPGMSDMTKVNTILGQPMSQSYPVAGGQTMSKIIPQSSIICPKNHTFDPDTGECEPDLSIIQSNPKSSGTQSTSKIVCKSGFTLNENTGNCEQNSTNESSATTTALLVVGGVTLVGGIGAAAYFFMANPVVPVVKGGMFDVGE